jgi:predicted ATPase
VESRFEALHTSELTELVGREEELELLLRRWSSVMNGEGQVVLLSGEAGIGKSRLIAALFERLATEPQTRLRYYCSPQHTDSAFYPIIRQLERVAGFAHDDTARAKLDKLDAMLAHGFTPPQSVALFADMLSLANDGRYPTLELSPQERRKRMLEALTAELEALARTNPVLMIFEDVHWIDPTSLEALSRAVDRIRTLGVLSIVTYRPEFEPPWIGRPHVGLIALNRLTERDIAAMIDRVAGNKPLAATVREEIIERTDGIPLFVEEMTKAVLEAEGEGDARRTVTAVPSPAVPVPASLHASLMARLDRLGPAKEVAQIGAVIGREFSHALLAAVAHKQEPDLQRGLDALTGAGLLFRQGVPPHANYQFNHALVQDAAYGALLRDPRRLLHARIAETLEDQFAEIAENQPELLARHCTEAGLIEKAAGLWGEAGQRSLERSALLEAIAQHARALDLLSALPPTPARQGEQINLQIALVGALGNAKGFSAPETVAATERARLLIQKTEAVGELPPRVFSVLLGLCVANYAAFNGDAMRDFAAQFLTLAAKQGATVPLMTGHRLMGMALMYSGAIVESSEHFDEAVRLYDPLKHRPTARLNQDALVAALSHRALALWVLGYPVSALVDASKALGHAHQVGHAVSLMYGLSQSGMPYVLAGDYETANACADELVALADGKGSSFWKAAGMIFRGWCRAANASASETVHELTIGLTAYRSTGTTNLLPMLLSLLGKSFGDLKQFNEAWRLLDEAIAIARTSKELLFEAEVNRIAGEVALLSPPAFAGEAEAYFDRALSIANAQQAKSWELRAAMSMARLWRDQGKPQQARELLAPIYGWFTEGFETRDLKEAKALLVELANN